MWRGHVAPVNSREQFSFAVSPDAQMSRSVFDRSHGHKTTGFEGLLYPIFVDEVLPGDTFNLKMTAFLRLETLIYPIMDNLYFETFFFFVPNRIVWPDWEKLCGAQDNPGDTINYSVPVLTVSSPSFTPQLDDIFDHFGLPLIGGAYSADALINALPFRCYNKIWNDWFRDEDLNNSAIVQTDDGPDTVANYSVLGRNKRYDYFTSCRPWPQKGGTTVDMPLLGNAPVLRNTNANGWNVYQAATNTLLSGSPLASSTGALNIGGLNASLDPNGGLYANLAAASGISVNDFRLAVQTQKLLERDLRGGTRYTEIIRSHFKVISPDARLQRSEYLGGGSTPVVVNPVTQTTPNATPTETNALGVLGAYGVAAASNHGFVKSFSEHGYIIGLGCLRADVNYQQGLARLWSRQTRYDFYWPVFAHLGEQAVLNQEIYYSNDVAQNVAVFGYNEHWSEYRYKPSLITGQFRSNASGTLHAWHLAQDFGSLPTLNDDFIQEVAPMSRIKAVSSAPDFKLDMFFKLKCVRPMPVFSTPGLVDHF